MRSPLLSDYMYRITVVSDVSGQHIGPIFNAKAVQEEFFLDRLSRNVGNYQCTLRKTQNTEDLKVTLSYISNVTDKTHISNFI